LQHETVVKDTQIDGNWMTQPMRTLTSNSQDELLWKQPHQMIYLSLGEHGNCICLLTHPFPPRCHSEHFPSVLKGCVFARREGNRTTILQTGA
jgi:hypothetical protein